MDLIVWYRKSGEIRGFQLCYGKQTDQHAVTWLSDGSYTHARVDDGESWPIGSKSTPILVQDGHFDSERIAASFAANASYVDEPIRDLVVQKIGQFAAQAG
jgi:hypothetical protein